MPGTKRTPRSAGDGRAGTGKRGSRNGSPAPASAQSPWIGTRRVLIVHRRAADRRRLIASFTANGFAATAAASAAAARREAAAAAAASAPFSVAVIEDQLPGAVALKGD